MSGSGPPRRFVNFANWPDYIDTDPADPMRRPTLAEFTRRTGIEVNYSEPIIDDQEFFRMIGVPLSMGVSTGYDLIVVADWLAAQLTGLGWTEEISPAMVPNAVNLLPALRASPLGAAGARWLPWQAGFTGIGYNLAAAGRPVLSVSDLLTAPDLRGRVALVADMRDVMGLLLLDHGWDPRSFTPVEFDLAIATIERAVEAGQIRAVTNSYRQALGRGDIAACIGWAGDVLAEQRGNPDVGFAIPEAGGILWNDTMVVPAHSPHRDEAQELMNYYYEPEVAARVAVSQMFICPVAGAREALSRIEPAAAQPDFVFPGPELLGRCHYFARLTPVENAVFTEKFVSALGL